VAVYTFAGNRPVIHATAFIHPLASVIGRVEVGPECFIGPGASLRGDWLTIRLGAGSNVQDNCVIHGFPGVEVVLAEESHLGHGSIVHGARLERNVLVGMNAVVQDGVLLGEGVIVGSGCVVPTGMEVPAGKLVVGVPGKIVGDVRPELAAMKRRGTGWYQALARRLSQDFAEIDPEDCRDTVPPCDRWLEWLGSLEGWGTEPNRTEEKD
jgi:phenylacetic acid degradation protein